MDYGDLPTARCRVCRTTDRAQTVEQVRSFAVQLADRVEAVVEQGQLPLVLGGDCTITLGVLAGYLRRHPSLALLYLDGGLDAATPETYRWGMLDSMGVAHMLAESGTDPSLTRIGPRFPLMTGANVVPFGYIPGEPQAPELAFLARHAMGGYPVSEVRGRAREIATFALQRLERAAERFVVHFDVDVIDFLDFPAADVLQPQPGLRFADAFAALAVFCASPKFGGLVVTEFNPDHDDPEVPLAMALVEALAGALFPSTAACFP